MGLIDRFLNAIRLNDDFDDDDDFLDEEDDDIDDKEEEHAKPKKKRFFSRFSSDDEDDDDDDDEDDDDDLSTRSSRSSRTSERSSRDRREAERSSSVRDRDNISASARSSLGRSGRSSSSLSSGAGMSSQARTVGYSTRPTSSVKEERERKEQADLRRKQPKVTPIKKKNASAGGMEVNVIRPSSMEETRDIADTLLQNCTVVLNLEGLDVDIAQRIIDFTCGVCYSLSGNLQKVSNYIFILTPENVELSGDFQSILSGAFDLAPMRSGF